MYNVLDNDLASRRARRATTSIMLVEDDALARRQVEHLFNRENIAIREKNRQAGQELHLQYALELFEDGMEVLAGYIAMAPNMVLLDIQLPDFSGHRLLEKILGIDPAAYVVMLSAHDNHENITRSLEAGAKGFITKPCSREKLMIYIERCPTIHR